jgi:RNA recognition motif-containing protein
MSNRLFVGNLAFHTTEDTLQDAFRQFGDVSEVKVVLDRVTGRSRGFGFVVMSNVTEAEKAMEQMNGAMLDGRALRVNGAEERRDRPAFGGGGGGGGGGFSRDRGSRW